MPSLRVIRKTVNTVNYFWGLLAATVSPDDKDNPKHECASGPCGHSCNQTQSHVALTHCSVAVPGCTTRPHDPKKRATRKGPVLLFNFLDL